MSRPGAVYIVRGVTSGLVKVGFSGWPQGRVRQVPFEVHEPVEALAAFPAEGPGYSHEAALHRQFAHLRALDAGRGREWFRDDGSIMAFVAALPAHRRGSFIARAPGKRGERHAQPTLPAWLLSAKVSDAELGVVPHPASPPHDASHSLNTAPARNTAPRGCGALPHCGTEAVRSTEAA